MMILAFTLVVAQFVLVLASVGLLIFAFSCLPLPVPYLPSHRKTIMRALAELDLRPTDTFYDIGSGDGRIVLAAHMLSPFTRCIGLEKRWGWHQVARYFWRSAGSPSQIHFCRGDFYSTSFADATKIYTFLCTSVMAELEPKFERELKGTLVVSCNFPFPHKQPLRVVDVAGAHTIFKKLYVYQY